MAKKKATKKKPAAPPTPSSQADGTAEERNELAPSPTPPPFPSPPGSGIVEGGKE